MKMIKKISCGIGLTMALAFACNQVTAFHRGEYQDSKRNVKVCVYEAFGKNYTYAVATYNVCPVTIQVCQRW